MSERRVEIQVDGTRVETEPDITVAAALLNANVVGFRTSVRGEPRAPLCGMGVCYECRVTIDGVAHQRACMRVVAPGMRVGTRGSEPPSANGPAGPSSDRVDVAVIGAGPAGIAAATRAAESQAGARVVVIDEGLGPGGQIWRPHADGGASRAASQWITRLERSGAIVHRATAVVDVERNPNGFTLRAESHDRTLSIESRAIVLATGARERFLPFPGWTLPNVFGIGGAQALLKNGMSFRGKRVVIAGTGPLLLPVAASLARAGARVMVVAEQASRGEVTRFAAGLWRTPARLAQAVSYRSAFLRTPYSTGTWIVRADGDTSVREVTLTDGSRVRTIECDVLCAAFGLVPNTALANLIGCELRDDTVAVDERQATTVSGAYCAGEPTGIGGIDLALVEGEIAGLAATGAAADARLLSRQASFRREARALDRAFALRPEMKALASDDTILCRCEDVPSSDIDPAWSPRQAKLYTRVGMGPCQGRICGGALECLAGWPADAKRPPIQPARLSTLATEVDVITEPSS
ncbi:MAG TPA: FAD-dependent oxidoreductase [Gemmatimonadaceae bacterium]|nr:FAD-dependent oxidoreductase [Gemmatimonadaceae bacterium]